MLKYIKICGLFGWGKNKWGQMRLVFWSPCHTLGPFFCTCPKSLYFVYQLSTKGDISLFDGGNLKYCNFSLSALYCDDNRIDCIQHFLEGKQTMSYCSLCKISSCSLSHSNLYGKKSWINGGNSFVYYIGNCNGSRIVSQAVSFSCLYMYIALKGALCGLCHSWLPCRHGTYAEAIVNQCNSFWSEPILNVSWTNLTRRFDQTSFILPIVVRIILILYNPFVDCLYFGLVQDSAMHTFISVHTHSFRLSLIWASAEAIMPAGLQFLHTP